MDYNELQALAKKYGIASHRVSRKELEAAISKYEEKNNLPASISPELTPPVITSPESDTTPNVEATTAPSSDSILPEQKTDKPAEPTKPAEVAPEFHEGDNVAIVYKGAQEVRRYSLADHGEDFPTLAKSFAAKNKLRLKFIAELPAVYCKSCGAKL